VVGNSQFIAKVEYLSDSKSVLFHTVPGANVKINERFRELKPSICEHCNKSRMRSETFIVCNTITGEQKQVGRNCLADFTGIHTPQQLAGKASWLQSFQNLKEELGEYWSSGKLFGQTVDTEEMLALTSAYITMFGWVPKSACQAGATSNLVARHYWPGGGFSKGEAEEMAKAWDLIETDPKHNARAAEVVAWIKNELAAKARSDYEMNLVTLVALNLTEQKHTGIVCSAVSAYQRAMNQQVEYAKKKEANKNSQYLGAVGQRMKDFPVKVEFVKSMEGAFGATTLIKFSDAAGNLMSWFASGDRDYKVGESIVIDGTVKAHKEYQGIKETALTRVKLKNTVTTP